MKLKKFEKKTFNLIKSICQPMSEYTGYTKEATLDYVFQGISITLIKEIVKTYQTKLKMNRKIASLTLMHKLFKYWHVAHLPFAIIMIVLMILHVVVTILMGYKWIL